MMQASPSSCPGSSGRCRTDTLLHTEPVHHQALLLVQLQPIYPFQGVELPVELLDHLRGLLGMCLDTLIFQVHLHL